MMNNNSLAVQEYPAEMEAAVNNFYNELVLVMNVMYLPTNTLLVQYCT